MYIYTHNTVYRGRERNSKTKSCKILKNDQQIGLRDQRAKTEESHYEICMGHNEWVGKNYKKHHRQWVKIRVANEDDKGSSIGNNKAIFVNINLPAN